MIFSGCRLSPPSRFSRLLADLFQDGVSTLGIQFGHVGTVWRSLLARLQLSAKRSRMSLICGRSRRDFSAPGRRHPIAVLQLLEKNTSGRPGRDRRSHQLFKFSAAQHRCRNQGGFRCDVLY